MRISLASRPLLSAMGAVALASLANGQAFGPQQVISATAGGARWVHAADLDGDGDMDVLSANQLDDEIAWSENLGGGVLGPQQVITSNAIDAWGVYAADLDGDGDMDVLSASATDNKIAWYENQGGGAFGPQQVVTTAADSARSVYATDLDGDGDADILSASANDSKVAWYENLGSGAFGPQQVIANSASGATSAVATDLDGDGDADVLSASAFDNKVAWYENLGGGAFSSQRVITTDAALAFCVFAADLDGDGDADAMSASRNDNKIAWYENDGMGNFGAQQVITTGALGANSVYATDLDGDGDLDALSASVTDNKVAWYENLGGGAFSGQQVISMNADFPCSASAADLDGDGEVDVISASRGDNKIAWYENLNNAPPPSPNGAFSAGVAIDTGLGEPWCVETSDVDLDGDLDILVAAHTGDTFGWYANDGQGHFGGLQVITAAADGAFSLKPADLDGDGDEDLLTASAEDDTVAWHENLGGAFGPRQTIDTTADGARTVVAADLDGDGDLDAIAGSMNDDTVSWYPNLGNGNFGPRTIITSAAAHVLCVDAADMDGDGDVDVLATSWNGAAVAWFANDGAGGGWIEFTVTTNLRCPTFVRPADLDGDGDIDVVASGHFDSFTGSSNGSTDSNWLSARYLNEGGGVFSSSQSPVLDAGIDPECCSPTAGIAAIAVCDVDLDGDSDVLGAVMGQTNSPVGSLTWVEAYESPQAGDTAFLPAKPLAVGIGRATDIHGADLTGDGLPDVLATVPSGSLWLFENRIQPFTGVDWAFLPSGEPAGQRWDMDGDGDYDVMNGNVCQENLGGGAYGAATSLSSHTFAGRDLNGDGYLDFYQLREVPVPGAGHAFFQDEYWLQDLQVPTSGVPDESTASCLDGAYFLETKRRVLTTVFVGVFLYIDDLNCVNPGYPSFDLAVQWSSYNADIIYSETLDGVTYSYLNLVEGPNLQMFPAAQRILGQSDVNLDGTPDILFEPAYNWPGAETGRSFFSSSGGGGLVQDGGLWFIDAQDSVHPLEPRATVMEGGSGGGETYLDYTTAPPPITGFADLNSDGISDMLIAGGRWRPGYGNHQFAAPRGTGGLPIPDAWDHGRPLHISPPILVDVNSDGRPDIEGTYQGQHGWWINLEIIDCNGNGIADVEDIQSGISDDCDGDGVPDECQIQSGAEPDCNANGVLDSCEVLTGAADCDGDGVLDSCQMAADATLDLNTNGTLDACEAIGTTYCAPAVSNSTGLPGEVTLLGSELAFFNQFQVSARQLPANSFGYFVCSLAQGPPTTPPFGSQGSICVSGNIGRGVGGGVLNSGSDGFFYGNVNLNAVPQPSGPVAVAPGETWHFQAWYRDANPTVTSNFTDAVAVTFQ